MDGRRPARQGSLLYDDFPLHKVTVGLEGKSTGLAQKKAFCILNIVFTYYRTYSRTSSLWTRAITLAVGYMNRTETIHLAKLKPLGAFRRCIPERLCVAVGTVPNTPGLGCDDGVIMCAVSH